jgi:hypothetical protein
VQQNKIYDNTMSFIKTSHLQSCIANVTETGEPFGHGTNNWRFPGGAISRPAFILPFNISPHSTCTTATPLQFNVHSEKNK